MDKKGKLALQLIKSFLRIEDKKVAAQQANDCLAKAEDDFEKASETAKTNGVAGHFEYNKKLYLVFATGKVEPLNDFVVVFDEYEEAEK